MSWNFLKPRRSIPAEDDVARECEKIKRLEETSKKLLKEGKKLVEANANASKAAVKVGADLHVLFTDDDDGKDKCIPILERTMEQCGKFYQEKGNLTQETLVEPMKRYTSTFPQLNAHIKGHEKSLQEYKKLQAKVDKMRDKEETGPNIVKLNNLKKDLIPVKKEYDAKRSMLLDDFPAFYNNRLQYLQPIFDALVRSEIGGNEPAALKRTFDQSVARYFGNFSRSQSRKGWPTPAVHNKTSFHNEFRKELDKSLNELTDDDPERDLQSEIADTLEQIRGLSITKD